MQDVPDLAAVSNQYKHLYYQYDLISGKVNQVDYSPGQRDEYHHRYSYDADNRIVQVETSKDAILWDKDANYEYYKHGPLSRAELGDLKVQGLDYSYTIQGWIKGVNSNTLSAVRDPGRDGDLSLSGNTHAKVATDAFGYTLGYFAGDYNPIGTFTTASKFEASTAGSDLLAARSDLWNGNISHMVTCLPKAGDYAANQTITPEAFGSAYKYDQLNRLSSSRVFTNINNTTNQWQSGSGTNPTAYATDYTYDAMGNILTQKRNGGGASPTALDELTYNYHTTTDGLVSNRLYQVNDVVSAGNYTDDIDDQGTFNNTHSTIETANNYGYDELGNLVRDAQEEIASIEWTVYGKMKKITRNSGSSKADLEFGYDASGNRLWKKVTPKGSGAVISTYYYLRDAQGNEMCRYVKYTNTTSQLMYVAQEHSIYGSSRVGVDNRKDTLYKAGSYSPSWGGVGASRRELGLKSFELANHLGNVLVTISDKPIYKVSSGTIYFQPEVSSISDYYPFGAPIHGRGYSSEAYRFGFNTQEKIDEISGPGNHNTATFWEYDGRLVLRWNQDPKFVIGVSPYAINGDNPIFYTDPKGDFKTWLGAQLYKYSHGARGYVSKANSGIHKGEWSVSNRVDTKGGEPANEISVGEVRIKQQVRWEWWQSNTTEKAQSGGGASGDPTYNNVNTGLGALGIGWGTKELMMKAAVAEVRGISIAKVNSVSNLRVLGSGAWYTKLTSQVSRGSNLLGAGMTLADGAVNGFHAHHAADLGIQSIIYGISYSIPIAGWIVGGGYILGDMYFQSTHNGMSITQYYLDGKK